MYTLIDGVTRRVYEIIQEFEYKNISGIRYWEVFLKHPVKTFAVPVLLSNLLGNNDPLVKYFIKYEPTFFVNINNVVEPTIIDIDKEIMETLELLQEGMVVN